MEWHDIRVELPNVRDKVLLCLVHWKNRFPQSYEIYGAGISRDNNNEIYFENIDDIGMGCLTWSLYDLKSSGDVYWMSEADAKKILPPIKED